MMVSTYGCLQKFSADLPLFCCLCEGVVGSLELPLSRLALKATLPQDWLASYGRGITPADAMVSGQARTVLSLSPLRANFICRQQAGNAVLRFLTMMFNSCYEKPPICAVLGSPGSGKSEFFKQLVHAFHTQDFVAVGGAGGADGYMRETLCIAVTLNCATCLRIDESSLSLQRILILRIYYSWFSDKHSFSQLFKETDVASICRCSLAEMISKLCTICGKQRCVLLIDEPIKLLHMTGNEKDFVDGITAVVSQQTAQFAVVFSSLLLDPFLQAVRLSNREIIKVPMTLLSREEVAHKLLPELVGNHLPNNHLTLQCSKAGAGDCYFGLAGAVGGLPRLIEFAATHITTCSDTSASQLLDSAVQRYSELERFKESIGLLQFEVMRTILLDEAEEMKKLFTLDDRTYSCDLLVCSGLLHRNTTDGIVVPQFVLKCYSDKIKPRCAKEAALIKSLGFLFAGESAHGTGKPWEAICLSVDRINRVIRKEAMSVGLLEIYGTIHATAYFVGHTLSEQLLAMRFNLEHLEEVKHYGAETNFKDIPLNILLSCIWYPTRDSNAGFDYAVFLLPIGAEAVYENVVVIVTECKFSADTSKTCISWTQVGSKRKKAIANVARLFRVAEANMVFRIAPWRHLPEPHAATELEIPPNVIAQSKGNLAAFMGSSLSLVVENLGIFTA
jgi:nucleoside-triphosphatase THEP1